MAQKYRNEDTSKPNLTQTQSSTSEDVKFIEALVPFWTDSGGNDCQFFIIKALPATFKKLARKIPYPESRVRKELGRLKKRGIVYNRRDVIV